RAGEDAARSVVQAIPRLRSRAGADKAGVPGTGPQRPAGQTGAARAKPAGDPSGVRRVRQSEWRRGRNTKPESPVPNREDRLARGVRPDRGDDGAASTRQDCALDPEAATAVAHSPAESTSIL